MQTARGRTNDYTLALTRRDEGKLKAGTRTSSTNDALEKLSSIYLAF
jgi:hypothetical protein